MTFPLTPEKASYASHVAHGHYNSPEVQAWLETHSDAGGDEIFQGDWSGCDLGPFATFDEFEDAIIGALDQILSGLEYVDNYDEE